MTLVLTAACPLYIVQIADRLLTVSNSSLVRPVDPIANKTIIYRATDSIVTIGYSGIAYVNHTPTDEWIASILWGAAPQKDSDRRAFSMQLGNSLNEWSLHTAVNALATEIRKCAPHKEYIEITIAGWRRFKKRATPIIIEIEKPRNESEVFIRKSPRHWVRGKDFRCCSVGVHASPEDLRSAFAPYRSDRGLRVTASEVEQVFISYLHSCADTQPTIGRNILSVFLPRPGLGVAGGCRFISSEPHPAFISTPGGRIEVNRTAHTPWILTPGMRRAPSAEVGDWQLDLAGYPFNVIGEPRGESGLCGFSTSIRRPPLRELINSWRVK